MPKHPSTVKVSSSAIANEIVLRGFFAKGNMGDEALVHSIVRNIGPEFAYKFALNSPEF